jgi:hypothetical protein
MQAAANLPTMAINEDLLSGRRRPGPETKKPLAVERPHSVCHIDLMVPCGLALAPCVAGCRAVTGPVPYRHSSWIPNFLNNSTFIVGKIKKYFDKFLTV